MNILIINCGSSSLKYQLIDSKTEQVLAKGICERIGIPESKIAHQSMGKEKITEQIDMPTHTKAVALLLEKLMDPTYGIIQSLDEIGAVGHRIVHGGEKFSQATLLTDEVMDAIEECNELAPLHNPANLIGINSCKEIMPNVPMVGVFDTAFHQTMPKKAYLYGIPYEYYEKYKVRRYGFHGTSHDYVSQRTAEILGKKREDMKIIVCHLGNGASVTAVKNGISVDTSMGMTPLEGLIMGTRSGDIDPAIIQFVGDKENLSLLEMNEILNKQSGVYGMSKLSSDFRDIEDGVAAGNELAITALETFSYRVAKYVGAYAAAMNGVDAVVFTAGVGENTEDVRVQVVEYLGYLGAYLDKEKNHVRGIETIISTDDSKVKVMIVPTNEELAIAREVVKLIQK